MTFFVNEIMLKSHYTTLTSMQNNKLTLEATYNDTKCHVQYRVKISEKSEHRKPLALFLPTVAPSLMLNPPLLFWLLSPHLNTDIKLEKRERGGDNGTETITFSGCYPSRAQVFKSFGSMLSTNGKRRYYDLCISAA